VIGGGSEHHSSSDSVIGGGSGNTIRANSKNSVIGGGRQNLAAGEGATVAGGESSGSISNYATVGGGLFNVSRSICDGGGRLSEYQRQFTRDHRGAVSKYNNAQYATVAGGYQNTIQPGGTFSAICAGKNNTIELKRRLRHHWRRFRQQDSGHGSFSAIGGGFSNTIGTNTQGSVISGRIQFDREPHRRVGLAAVTRRHPDERVWFGHRRRYLNTIMTNADLSPSRRSAEPDRNQRWLATISGAEQPGPIAGATVGGGEKPQRRPSRDRGGGYQIPRATLRDVAGARTTP